MKDQHPVSWLLGLNITPELCDALDKWLHEFVNVPAAWTMPD